MQGRRQRPFACDVSSAGGIAPPTKNVNNAGKGPQIDTIFRRSSSYSRSNRLGHGPLLLHFLFLVALSLISCTTRTPSIFASAFLTNGTPKRKAVAVVVPAGGGGNRRSRGLLSMKGTDNQQQLDDQGTTTATIDDTANNKRTAIDLSTLEQQLKACQSGTMARRVLEDNLLSSSSSSSSSSLYRSVVIPPDSTAKGMSDGDLAIMTRIRNTRYNIMELIDLNGNRDADRASLAVLSVFVGSSLSAILAQQGLGQIGFVPEILRFVVVWLLSFAPLALVGYGIASADSLQALLVSIQRVLLPTYRQRMIQHEAGHFLMAHLLGFPIAEYKANAVKNAVTFYPLNDPDVGSDRARLLGFDTTTNARRQQQEAEESWPQVPEDKPFFSPEGRGADTINQQSVFRKEQRKTNYTKYLTMDVSDQINEPRESWPFRGFDDTTLDQLTVISVAGVAAEILAFGNAEGGLADFNQLKRLLQSADKDEPITEREMENRVRFALGYSMSQLRRHLGALDDLAEVMERDGSIAECVYAIETCASVSGNDGIREDYEIRRKKEQQFQQQNPLLKLVESVLLGQTKTADVQEDRYVEGKGGGYKKENQFAITGDDPLYLALGVSFVFFVWASTGGLTLH